MKLSKRIYALVDCIRNGESVADIGTDHGYVPMLLIREGISPKAIMSDISADSLSKAVSTFRETGLSCDESCFRVADGIEGIECGEVDDIIVAGLGAHTIISILDSDTGKTRSFRKLILQPRKHSGNLRHYLYVNGYDIIEDILVPEGKFMCEIIVAQPSDVLERDAPYPVDAIEWKYPSSYEKLPNEYVEKRIGWKLSSIDEELMNLKTSRHDRSDLISRLREERNYLVNILDRNRENSNL